MKTITVFTPTFNRAYCLNKCYESLIRQTNENFKWLIIDDGSTDNTRQLVEEWIEEEKIEIRYIYKENGGLHTAYNIAIENIDTELCVCIDSDDFMPNNAIEIILEYWDKYGDDKYAGIVGLDYYTNGEVIGDKLPNQFSVNLIDLLTNKYKIRNGDRKNVVRTELYKKVAPMKSFDNEKNFNPHYMHLLISKDYDFLVLNENLCFVEYQENGMSNNMFKQYANSPKSFAETRKLYLSFPNTSFKFKFRNSIHYVSSSILAKNINFLNETPYKWIAIISLPFGLALTQLIRWKNRK